MRILTLAVVGIMAISAVAPASATSVIAQWNYNTQATLALPSTGSGTFALIGGATDASSGAWSTHWSSTDGASSDPIAGPAPNNYGAYNTANIHVVGAGASWAVSTVGYYDIIATVDMRGSSTATRDWTWVYSVDGTTWIDASDVTLASGATWQNGWVLNLIGVTAADNNPNFKVGMVVRNAGGTSTSTMRFDMATVSGTVIPEPGSMVALGAGLVGFAGLLRRKSA